MKNEADETTAGFKRLEVWQKGMVLAREIYELTRDYPKDERFGLVAQMRRAAVSIPSNIAEGHARRTTGEFIQSISQAQGSAAELETQLLLAIDLHFSTKSESKPALDLAVELSRMLNSLRRRLIDRARDTRGRDRGPSNP
jgi:four helix bundle protein